MANETTRRNWLRANAAAMGWVIAGLPGMGRAAVAAAASPRRSGMIRLGYNENPYGPSGKAVAAMSEELSGSNRYGLELPQRLRQVIARAHALDPGHVLLGAGSSEILALATGLAAKPGPGHILMGTPTYMAWLGPGNHLGLEPRTIELDRNHRHDLGAMTAAIDGRTRMVFICNPANPAGTVLPEEEFRGFIREAARRALVVVDEAYYDFRGEGSVASLVREVPNLVVTRTFSKLYGLAGLRIGFGLTQAAGALASRQGWPNLGASQVSTAAALASLQDAEYLAEMRDRNRKAVEFTGQTLKELGIEYIPSATNFVLFDASSYKGDLGEALGRRRVLVRNWGMKGKPYCRVSMGTPEEMDYFAEQLKKVLKG